MEDDGRIDAMPEERTELMKNSDVLLPTRQPTSSDRADENGLSSDEDLFTDEGVPVIGFISRYINLPYADLPMEANGCVIDTYARATINLAYFFVGTALLKLALHQALSNCFSKKSSQDDFIIEECMTDPKIFGFKPSSLLTNMGALGSFISVVSLPIVGAVVDFTPYRRQVGLCMASGLTLIKILEIGIRQRIWFFVVCLQVLSSLFFQTEKAAMYAYSAELSHHPTTQSKFQSSLALTLFASMFLYLLEVQVLSRVLDLDNDVHIARLAVIITVLNCLPLYWIGWGHLFPDKPPASILPAGQNILTAGFLKLHRTFHEISSNYKAVRHFLVFSLAWSEAGIAGLPIIITTYMSEFLEMSSLQMGLVLFVVMIGGIPGSVIGNRVCRRYKNPVRSAQVGLVVFILNTVAAGLFLRADSKLRMFGFSFVWGICLGWLHPQHTTIFVTISPQGQGSVELMGLYLFSCQILGFLPPLLFTVLNEMGVPMWVGIMTLALYTLIGLLGLVYMGDYEDARSLVVSDVDLGSSSRKGT